MKGRGVKELFLKRPARKDVEGLKLSDYVGDYEYDMRVSLEEGGLVFEDLTFNALYPIGKDTFFCTENPWTLRFRRDGSGKVDRIEFEAIRKTFLVKKRKPPSR